MIDYETWKLNELHLSKEQWGYEISGTVAEVIRMLQKAPQDRECIASVSFRKTQPQQPNP